MVWRCPTSSRSTPRSPTSRSRRSCNDSDQRARGSIRGPRAPRRSWSTRATASWPKPRCRCTPTTFRTAGSNKTRRRCSTRCSSAGRQAIAEAKRPVGLVALANQGETVLAWDRDSGRPLSPAIVWQDRRASRLCDELAEHADMLAARTGLVLDPYFSAPKMAWLRRNLTTDGVVTTTDSWLVHQLCGEFVTDASTASRSLLIDIDRIEWDPRLIEVFGLSDEPLPRIVELRRARGRHDRVRRPDRGRRSGGRPARGAARPGVLAARVGEVHVRDRRVPARQHRRAGRPIDRRADQLGCVAYPCPDRILRRRSGLHGRVGRSLAHRRGVHQRAERPRPVRRRGRRRRGVRLGARGAGRPVVAPGRDRHVLGYHARYPSQASRGRAGPGHRRASRRARPT